MTKHRAGNHCEQGKGGTKESKKKEIDREKEKKEQILLGQSVDGNIKVVLRTITKGRYIFKCERCWLAGLTF